jgi:hypothetical protein
MKNPAKGMAILTETGNCDELVVLLADFDAMCLERKVSQDDGGHWTRDYTRPINPESVNLFWTRCSALAEKGFRETLSPKQVGWVWTWKLEVHEGSITHHASGIVFRDDSLPEAKDAVNYDEVEELFRLLKH